MAKFCDKQCEEQGAICDFCKNYLDEDRDINKLNTFVGVGICNITKEEVDACDGFGCEHFECFRVK